MYSSNGLIEEDRIESLSEKRWEYRENCLRAGGTRDAFRKAQTCEVTIPVDSHDPQGK